MRVHICVNVERDYVERLIWQVDYCNTGAKAMRAGSHPNNYVCYVIL